VDEYRVRRDDFAVTDIVIASKKEAIVSAAGDGAQGTVTLALPPERRDAPALDDTRLRQVAELALAAEKYTGFPQDIEWAFCGGRLYLLQTHPVTRIPARWTHDESAERFPNVVTPMTWELVEEGFHASLNYSFSLMGLPSFGDKWFAMKDCYIYGNQNAVELYSRRIPVQMDADLQSIAAALPSLATQYAWAQNPPVLWMRDLDTYLMGIGALMQESMENKSLRELWDYVLRVRDLGRGYFLPNIAISLTQRSLYALLSRLLRLLSQDDAAAQSLFDTLLSNVDTRPRRSMANSGRSPDGFAPMPPCSRRCAGSRAGRRSHSWPNSPLSRKNSSNSCNATATGKWISTRIAPPGSKRRIPCSTSSRRSPSVPTMPKAGTDSATPTRCAKSRPSKRNLACSRKSPKPCATRCGKPSA
jgi:hypothetical protein